MKKNKIYSPIELDFDSGECKETFESKLSYVCNQVRYIKNPYIGNKSKILKYIIRTIEEEGIKYNSVLDLFSGSGCLSLVMKLMGKRVVANDLLASSYVYTHAFVENNTEELTEEEKEYLLTNRSEKEGFVLWNDDGTEDINKFTNEELNFLMDYRENANFLFYGLPNSGNLYNPYKLSLALACLQLYVMDRVFVGGRLYSGQIIARLDHRLEHQRNQGNEMNFEKIRWYDFRIKDDKNQHKAYKEDAYNLLTLYPERVNGCELAYIDPPYGGEQSNYFKMYDFFNYYSSSGASDSHFEVFNEGVDRFIKSDNYKDNFIKLLEALHETDIPTWVISYNDSSWADIETIKNILSNFKNNVKVYDLDYKYKYRDVKKSSGTEYLIISR